MRIPSLFPLEVALFTLPSPRPTQRRSATTDGTPLPNCAVSPIMTEEGSLEELLESLESEAGAAAASSTAPGHHERQHIHLVKTGLPRALHCGRCWGRQNVLGSDEASGSGQVVTLLPNMEIAENTTIMVRAFQPLPLIAGGG